MIRSRGCDNAFDLCPWRVSEQNFTAHDAAADDLEKPLDETFTDLTCQQLRSISFQQVVLFVIPTLETHDTGEIIHFLWHQDKYERVRLIFLPNQKKKGYTMSICYYSFRWQHRKWKISFVRAKRRLPCASRKLRSAEKLLKTDSIRARFHRERQIYLMARKSRLRNGETENA